MALYSDAMRQQAEADEAEVRAAISALDHDGLVEWCRTEFAINKKVLSRAKINPKAVISAGATQEDDDAAIELARSDRRWCEALIEVVKGRRLRGEAVPEVWREYLIDLCLGIEKRPDGRGKKNEAARNQQICKCIWQIARHTSFKATRNETSGDKPCAASIVSQALGRAPDYDGVIKVWQNRNKSLYP